jgi:signal transduction histidine kinase/ligand-binding sensor domain-containing protein/DNA-binding response OmpR family regulator
MWYHLLKERHFMWRLVLLFLLCIFLLIEEADSQKQFDFEPLAKEDGLTSSRANVIMQDRKGFIWIGTWNGLNRFDGYECEVFKPGFHDSTSISNREVVDLIEDHKGNIWIGTSFGLNCLDPVTKIIRKYEFESRIISLLEDQDHNIWVGTWGNGLYKLDPETGQRDRFLSGDIVSDIFEDSHKNLWIATYYGLVNLDRNSHGYRRYLPNTNNPHRSVNCGVVTQLAESYDGNLWVGTWGGGLDKVILHSNRDSLRFEYYTVGKRYGCIGSNDIFRLHYDDKGNLWIGSWDKGISLLSKEEQLESPEKAIFTNLKSDLSDPYSISGNNITALYVDRSGILWVGSTKIDRTSTSNNGIVRYNTKRLDGDMYAPSTVRSFACDNDGHLWVGTSDDLNLFREKDKLYELTKKISNLSYRFGANRYSSASVLSVLKTSAGLWVGTDDAGLLFYPGASAVSGKNQDVLFFNNKTAPSLPGNKVNNLVESGKYPGVIWVGTMQNGLAKLTYNGGQVSIKHYWAGSIPGSLSDNNIRSLIEDRDGKVWIGTQSGLNCFDPESETFKRFFYSSSDLHSINDNVINVVYEDVSGNLWIGTNAGLIRKVLRKDKDGVEIVSFNGFPGIEYLKDELVINILEDNAGYLWVGFYPGMVKFDPNEEKIVNKYFIREFQHIGIERASAIKTDDGKFLFGGANGFLSFDPENLLMQEKSPEAIITDIQIFNKSISGNTSKYSGTEKAIPFLNNLILSYKDEVFTIVFSAMEYKDPEKNQYAYILEGFDKQWNKVGERNTATYTGIPPGSYVFKVRAANSEGVWSKEPTVLNITVTPPWWKTTVAYILYGLLILGLLYFFKKYSIIQAREKGEIMLERLKFEKEHELNEMKTRFFTNITHEFRTPLTLILGPAEELLSSANISRKYREKAGLIHRNAQKLLRLVNQLMEFRKVEKEKMEMFYQKCDVVELLDDLYNSYKGLAESRNIDFHLTYNLFEIIACIDREKIEKVIFNLVSNAFKYSEDGGAIDVRADVEKLPEKGDSLIIEVEDMGIGIPPEHLGKIFDRFYQVNEKRTQSTGGIGLFLSKALVEQHGGVIEVESEPGKGSCFKVIVPLGLDNPEALGCSQENEKSEKVHGEALAENMRENFGEETGHENQTGKRKPKILIVEDDVDLNKFIFSGLTTDFSIKNTFNGREGLEMARKYAPDLIVTDIMMPELDGFELCKTLRRDLNTSHIPVVFLTAKTMREDEVKGLKLGAVDYIYKPFSLVSLKLKIRNILEQRNNIMEKFRADQILEPEEIKLSSLDETFLKQVAEAVNKYLDNPSFDVEKLSQEVGLSSHQVYRKIKALTGQTAKEFIRTQRLKTAASLLLQEKRSISEIIYMVGFSSPSYFARCFRDLYGCTPSEYIEQENQRF